jgi:putative ABC transport system permease protein
MRLDSLKMFFKYLAKNRLYTFVTISGFAASLMFVFLLSVYIKQELSVDQFHVNKNRIYRLRSENGSFFAPPIGDLIKNQFPEVEAYTRIFKYSSNGMFRDKQLKKFDFLMADSSFFNMFSFKLKEGDPKQVLALTYSAVLSVSFSRKIFGNEDPVGKTFTIDKLSFNITGIYEEFPQNTHFVTVDAILNFRALADIWGYKELLTTNGNSSFGLYFLAVRGTDLPSKAPVILEQFKKDYWPYSNKFSKTLKFEPLTEVYFNKESGQGIRQNSRTSITIFGAIALLILFISIINYVNLTVAQAGFRNKEMAIRKLMGGTKWTIISQLLLESVVLSSISAVVALYLSFLAEPFFNSQMNCNLNLSEQFGFSFILTIVLVVFSTGLISGIIPALVVNSFKPIDVVKGNLTRKTKSTYSKILIAFQYTIAIVLLICTWTIANQAKFMQKYNIGYDKENLFWMENTIKASQKTAFRNILKSIPGVIDVSYCKGTPIDGGNNQSFKYKDTPVSFQEFVVDSLFFNLMGMKVTNTTNAYSKEGVWLNRAAVQLLDLGEKPVSFRYYDTEVPVLGIINDFNFRSLHTKIGPLIVQQLQPGDEPWSIMVKISGANLAASIKKIMEAQSSFTAGMPMQSGLVEETLNQLYNRELKQSKLIGAFTLLSIIIASMGIFAMALYFIQQKVKEIGIRKINGAKVIEIMVMLNKDFVTWVAIAIIIAFPLAWFIMHNWLQNFAYKTVISWWIFFLAGVASLGIALITVSWQSWMAATRNPVEALRYE